MSPVPVTVLTGFLGSGKTTLLQRLLQEEEGSRMAVLINEFGEISIDHLMVKAISGNTVVLQNGCVCCSVRSELKSGLRELLNSRDKGELPEFNRIVVETTGLADPVPVVQTIRIDPMLRNQLRVANLVSTVDGVNGLEQLGTQEDALRQASTADRLVITKVDLCDPLQIERLNRVLHRLNPLASVCQSPSADDFWKLLISQDAFDPNSKSAEVRSWLGAADSLSTELSIAPDHHAHDHRGRSITSFAMRVVKPIDWVPFSLWLSLLVHRHGRNVLRVKGLLNVPEAKGPLSLNVVQNFIHTPVHLDAWPDEDRSSRLVFIVQELNELAIRSSLDNFLRRASQVMQSPKAARPEAML